MSEGEERARDRDAADADPVDLRSQVDAGINPEGRLADDPDTSTAGDAPTTADAWDSRPEAHGSPEGEVAAPVGRGVATDGRADSDAELVFAEDDASPSEPVPRSRSQIGSSEHFDRLEGRLASLDLRLEEANRLLERQTNFVDRLHEENQTLRVGELRTAQLPLVRDLMQLHDDVLRLAAEGDEATADLGIVREALLEAMRRSGVGEFQPDRGAAVDPAVHSVVGVDATEDPDLDKRVSEVVRVGFRWEEGLLVRAAEVRAHRYRAPEPRQAEVAVDEPEEQAPAAYPPPADGNENEEEHIDGGQ